jgi:preprotein translocase subunit SecG
LQILNQEVKGMSGFWSVLYGFLIVIHILACIIMMLTILLQAGRSAGLGAGFGGSSQTLFGAGGGTTFLAKFTATTAFIFVLTSIGIAKVSNRSGRGLEKKAKEMSEKLKKQKGTEVDLGKLGLKEGKGKGEEVKIPKKEEPGPQETAKPPEGGQPAAGGQPAPGPGQGEAAPPPASGEGAAPSPEEAEEAEEEEAATPAPEPAEKAPAAKPGKAAAGPAKTEAPEKKKKLPAQNPYE